MQRLERDVITGRGVSLYDVPPLYDLVIRPGPCETYYRELARRVGGPVLELACGTGRLTIPIAADGHEVVGLDASPAMLRTVPHAASGPHQPCDSGLLLRDEEIVEGKSGQASAGLVGDLDSPS